VVDQTPTPLISLFKRYVPAAAKFSDEEVANKLYNGLYKGPLSKGDFFNTFGIESEDTAFTRGFKNFVAQQAPEDLGSFTELLADKSPILKEELKGGAEYLKNLGAENRQEDIEPLRGKRFSEILKSPLPFNEKVDQFFTTLGELTGSAAGSTLPSVVAGTAGTLAGGPLGGIAGAAASSAPQNIGNLRSELIKEGVPQEEADNLALKYGAAISGLDVFGVGKLLGLSKITAGGAKKAALEEAINSGIIKPAAKGAATEGLTESLQEGIQKYAVSDASGKPLVTPENVEDVLTSGLVGGVTGGGFGALAGVGNKLTSSEEKTIKDQPENLRSFEEEVTDVPSAIIDPETLSPSPREEVAAETFTRGLQYTPKSQTNTPVKKGMVRVYHSGSRGEGEFGRWVSTNRKYASEYRPDLPLFYIDLPETDSRVNNADIPEQGVKQGFTFNFELSPKEAYALKQTDRNLNGEIENNFNQILKDTYGFTKLSKIPSAQIQVQQNELSTILKQPEEVIPNTVKEEILTDPEVTPKDIDILSDVIINTNKVKEVNPDTVTPALNELTTLSKAEINLLNSALKNAKKPKGEFISFVPEEGDVASFPSTVPPKRLFENIERTKEEEKEVNSTFEGFLGKNLGVNPTNIPLSVFNNMVGEEVKARELKRAKKQEKFVAPVEPTTQEVIKERLRNVLPSGGVPLSKINQEVLPRVNKIINSITSPKDTIQPSVSLDELVDNIQDGQSKQDPVKGVQTANYLLSAVKPLKDVSVPELTESYYYLRQNGFINKDDIKTIQSNYKSLLKYLKKQNFITNPNDLQQFLDTQFGEIELEATAFAYFLQDKNYSSNLGPIKTVFTKLEKAFQETGKELRKNGVESVDSLFSTLPDSGITAEQAIYESLVEIAADRYAKMASEARVASALETVTATDPNINLEDLKKLRNNSLGKGAMILSNIPQKAFLADKIPGFEPVFSTYLRKSQDNEVLAKEFNREYADILKQYTTQQSAAALDALDHLRTSDQPITIFNDQAYYKKEGKNVRLTLEVTQALKEFDSLFKNVGRIYSGFLKDRLKPLGIQGEVTAQKIDERVADLKQEKAVEGISENDSTAIGESIKILETAKESLDNLNSLLNSNKPYIPHMRFGKFGISVKDRETGETLGLFTIEQGLNDKPKPDQLKKVKEEVNAKYSDRSKYKVSDTFLMTTNEVFNMLGGANSRLVTTELLASLLQGVDQDTYKGVMNEIKLKSATSAIQRHFLPNKNIDGYSKDWGRVVPSYLSSMAYHLTNLKYDHAESVILKEASNVQNPSLRRFLIGYINDSSKPDSDYAKIRAFNFLFTMGANMSTAIINTFTPFLQGASKMAEYSPNIIYNNKVISTNFAKATLLMGDAGRTGDLGDRRYLKSKVLKGSLKQEEATFLDKLFNSGLAQGSALEDATGGSTIQPQGNKDKLTKGVQDFTRSLGFLSARAEQLSRLSLGLASFEVLNNPKALQRAVRVMRNEPLFQSFLKDGRFNEREAVAAYSVLETHGILAKYNRPEILKGAFGAISMPFMTWPITITTFLYKQAFNRGAEGKYALLTHLFTVALLFGVSGLPFMEFFKDLYEIYKGITGEKRDANLALREALLESGIDPDTALLITDGLSRSYADISLSNRVAVPVFFQSPLNTLAAVLSGDNIRPSDIAGPAGSFVTNIVAGLQGVQEGKPPLDVLVGSVAPVAFANAYKGIVDYGNKGIVTGKGTQILPKDEVTLETKLAKTMGFQSSQEATSREVNRAEQLAKNPAARGTEIYAARGVNFYQRMKEARTEAEYDEAFEDYRTNFKDYVQFLKDAKIVVTSDKINGFKKSIRDKVLQKDSVRAKRLPKNLDMNLYNALKTQDDGE
jgi:hypothetical protein